MPDKVTTAAAYAASGTTVVAGLTLNEWAAAVGIAVAILTFSVNLYFQCDKRRREIEADGKRPRKT